jgi:hypothetical protein
MLHDDLKAEYYAIAETVTAFDQRLLTIKGWGVTLSLTSLGLGFQQGHYGLFLVAAASGLAFWLVEGSIKQHQMRYYPRMGDIEVAAYELYRHEGLHGPVSSPLIDWGWYTAGSRVRRGTPSGDPQVPSRWPDVNAKPGKHPLLFPHVALPHLISVGVGAILFIIGLSGGLGPI